MMKTGSTVDQLGVYFEPKFSVCMTFKFEMLDPYYGICAGKHFCFCSLICHLRII